MDQVLFNQHAAQFVDKGRRILCFNNGRHPDRWWSTIDEIEINPLMLAAGDGGALAVDAVIWKTDGEQGETP